MTPAQPEKTPGEPKPGLDLLTDGSLWERVCNGKRYMLVGKLSSGWGGEPRVWLYQEGKNRCLHLRVSTVLKCYRPLDRSKFKVSFQ